MKFPRYLSFKDRVYSIQGYIDDVMAYVDNKGYVDISTGQIYICSKNEEPRHKDVPILKVTNTSNTSKNTKIKDETIEKIDSHNPVTQKNFNIDNTYDLSIETIQDNTNGNEVLYNEEALRDMNAATSIFVPVINDDDDPLKKVIKQVIISKQIDINRLKHKMPRKYGLSNMKSALVGNTKMSIQNFCIWCELLGVNFEVCISDNHTDMQNPLFDDVVYTSSNNKLFERERDHK